MHATRLRLRSIVKWSPVAQTVSIATAEIRRIPARAASGWRKALSRSVCLHHGGARRLRVCFLEPALIISLLSHLVDYAPCLGIITRNRLISITTKRSKPIQLESCVLRATRIAPQFFAASPSPSKSVLDLPRAGGGGSRGGLGGPVGRDLGLLGPVETCCGPMRRLT